jgi:hypothetical protein
VLPQRRSGETGEVEEKLGNQFLFSETQSTAEVEAALEELISLPESEQPHTRRAESIQGCSYILEEIKSQHRVKKKRTRQKLNDR